jgi:adenosylcobinamide-GDP ribazoletransferase
MLAEVWLSARIALAFLTRLPVSPPPPPESPSTGYLARATGMFPLVGAGIGLLAALAYLGSHGLGLPPLACAFVAVAAGTMVTGALHEDGLADLADGLGGGRTRDDRLRIMRDSRIGSFGAVAMVFSVGLRVALVAGLSTPAMAGAALMAAAAGSRAPLPALLRWLPPARAEGLAAAAGRPRLREVTIAAILSAAIVFAVLDPAAGVVVVLAIAGAAALVAWIAWRSVGGHTGDVLGAAQQIAEIAALAAVAAAL